MGEEWVPTKVADLKAGDEVRDWGYIKLLAPVGKDQAGMRLVGNGFWQYYWPAHATVDVQRGTVYLGCIGDDPATAVLLGEHRRWVASFASDRHAECYAEKLRNRPDLRAEALGQS